MEKLTPEQIANLPPEQQADYLKTVAEEEAYQQSLLQGPVSPEEEAAAQQVPEQIPEEGFLSSVAGAVKKVAEPLMEYGGALEKGFEQGLLSGGAEETRAAALAAAGGDYESAKKEQEAAFKESEEEYPGTTFLGELAGSVAQGAAISAATGGAALPASVANFISKLSKANKAMQVISKVAKPAARIAKTAAIGAVEGAAQGVLKSEKSLYDQAKESFKEAKKGAALGGVLGGGLETAAKVTKKAAGGVGDFISKKIDEGQMPPSLRPIREGFRYGEKGIGVSSEESLKRPVKNLMNVLENKVQPKVVNSLREVKDLSNYLLENVNKPIDIDEIVESGVSNLKSQGHLDANKFADYIKNRYKAIQQSLPEVTDVYGQATGKSKKIPLNNAKMFVRELQAELDSKPQLNENFKNIVNDIKKNVDSLIDTSITDADAAEAVLKNPEATLNFLNLLRNASPENLAEDILVKLKSNVKFKNPEEAVKKAKETSKKIIENYKSSMDDLFKDLDSLPYDQKLSEVSNILKDPRSRLIIQEAAKNLGPVKILDGKMRNILSAHELLTGKSIAKTDVEKVENIMELFKTITGQTKEGVSADINRATYDKALDLLGSAIPEVADDIQKVIKPAALDLFMIRYLHGIGFDPALKDTAIVQKILGPGAKIATQAANLSAQALQAAKKGVSGPIVGLPTTTMLRPTVSTLKSLKNRTDSMKGPIPEMISERLQAAINAPDEGRRIAILNTLMSYDYFRNMVKDVKLEE